MAENLSGMRVLVVGDGGREHALIWKLAQSPLVGKIFAVPGNAGTAQEPKTTPYLVSPDHKSIVAAAKARAINLVVIGPEAPLADGLADALDDADILVLGPRKLGAALEASKVFAKDFMTRHGIPTAPYAHFSEFQAAEEYIRSCPLPVVIKADGLSRGKGTAIARTAEEALQAARKKLAQGRIVVEKFLDGEEATYTCLVAGGAALPLPSSQDHKRLLEQDRGPMTGGMGAYSPAPVVDEAVEERIYGEIIIPLLRGLEVEMIAYTGFLYIGLMIEAGQPYVLEFNCRLGDPEAQALLMRFEGDFASLLFHASRGRLEFALLEWDPRPAVCVVLTAAGYPEEPRKRDVIWGLERLEALRDTKVFHAGTDYSSGKVVTAGGRVLGVTAIGNSVGQARDIAYNAIKKIRFPGMHYRRDIGHRAVAREMAQ